MNFRLLILINRSYMCDISLCRLMTITSIEINCQFVTQIQFFLLLICYSNIGGLYQILLCMEYKAGLTLNDLYNTNERLTIGFQIFICVYTIIQVVHPGFIKVVLTKYSTFKSSSKIIKEQAAAAVIIALNSEKIKSRKMR